MVKRKTLKLFHISISDKGVVKVAYYHLREIGIDEKAEGLVNEVLAQFESDGILELMKERLAGVVTDGM